MARERVVRAALREGGSRDESASCEDASLDRACSMHESGLCDGGPREVGEDVQFLEHGYEGACGGLCDGSREGGLREGVSRECNQRG